MQDLGQNIVEVIDISGKILAYYRISLKGDLLNFLDIKRDATTILPGFQEKHAFQAILKRFFGNNLFRFPVVVLVPETAAINLTLEVTTTGRFLSLQQQVAVQLKRNFGVAIEEFLWRFYPLNSEEKKAKYAVSLVSKRDMKTLRRVFAPLSYQFEKSLTYLPSLFAHLNFFENIALNPTEASQTLTIFGSLLIRHLRRIVNGNNNVSYDFKDIRLSVTNETKDNREILSQVVELCKVSVKNLILAEPEEILKLKEIGLQEKLSFYPIKNFEKFEEVSLTTQSMLIGTVAGLNNVKKNNYALFFDILRPNTFSCWLKKLNLTKTKAFTGLCLILVSLGILVGWYNHQSRLIKSELSIVSLSVQALEDGQNKFRKLQSQVLTFQALDNLKQRWIKFFSVCQHTFSNFGQPIWLDNLTSSNHNNTSLSEKGVSFLISSCSPFGEMLPHIRKVIKMQGKILNVSLSVDDLKRRFIWCLEKAKTLNEQKSLNVMDLDIKPKASRSDETDFVCSLLLEPEDYL